MNPTKTIVDQAEAALRLFFAESREDAARLLEMYGPLVRMFERDLDAADEVRHLVLDRFPAAEPPSVPGLDFLPAVQADAATLVGEAVAALDEPAPRVWDDSVPPGGWVCGVCRTPVESEPCELHGAVTP